MVPCARWEEICGLMLGTTYRSIIKLEAGPGVNCLFPCVWRGGATENRLVGQERHLRGIGGRGLSSFDDISGEVRRYAVKFF